MNTSGDKRLHIVVGIVLSNDRRNVLLARRSAAAHQGGLWEFPGGKLQEGETAGQALVRELKEELSVDVHESRGFLRFLYDYPDRKLDLDIRLVESWSGTPQGREGQPLQWAPLERIGEIDFPPANRRIIKALTLPEICFFTPDAADYGNDFLERLQRVLDSGVGLLRFRSTDLTGPERLETADRVGRLCRRRGCRFLFDGSPEEVMALRADGLHLTSERLRTATARPLGEDCLVAASCHDDREIIKAVDIGADFCVLGPVKPTASHPGAATLGWERFAELAGSADIPVYALGGLVPDDLDTARRHGAHGIALISALWQATSW